MGTFQEGLKARLPLSLADYMEACNTHYYTTRDPFGVHGDFITAPEISQVYGEIIGLFLAYVWKTKAHTGPFNLVEGGPGRGTLMADLWRAARTVPGFQENAQISLIETSESLRGIQKEKLKDVDAPLNWLNNISDISLKNSYNYMIFNELMDALSVRQFQYHEGIWYERFVKEAQGRLVFTREATNVAPPIKGPKQSDIYELSPARTALMEDICRTLAASGGVAVIVDYGTGNWMKGDSVQALYKHNMIPVLERPGDADITSHVDFGSLADVARAAGLYVHPLMTQGHFLDHLGGRVRAAKLGQESAYARLTDPNQMGDLFKVLIIAHPDWEEPVREIFG